MLTVSIEMIGNLAVLECEGQIAGGAAALRLRDAVTSQSIASIILLDLSEVNAIDSGCLGILVFLQRWAHDQDIHLKLFNPSCSVRHWLEQASSTYEFQIATLDEVMALMARAASRHAPAA